MSRLMYAVVFTKNFDAMREFYEKGVGLRVRHAEPAWVEFDTAGAALALHDMPDETRQGMLPRFETADLESSMRELKARGVKFDREPIAFSKGRLADIWDPEDNLIQVFEPAVPAPSGAGPRMGTVIVNVRDFIRALSFYRDRMGLHVVREAPHWVEFDTGITRLALHGRPAGADHPRHAEESVTFALEGDDLTSWADAMRGRGIAFVTAPVLEEFGVYAEVADPDGRIIVLRETPVPATLEEELAEPYEDDGPQRIAIRKPVKKGSAAVSVLKLKPNFKTHEAPKRRRPSATTRRVASVRGAGPDHARLRPKKTGDEKKARVKPAIGRLRKAERKAFASQKRAAANASKRRPVKRAAAKVTRRGR